MQSAHSLANGWRYGLLGLPLAFVSLPLYVHLPRYYAQQLGVPLATLGLILLATRLLDAALDPRIGRWVDSLFARRAGLSWRAAAWGSVGLAFGFAALWQVPAPHLSASVTLIWLSLTLIVTYLAYSVVSMVHQAWGARWGGQAGERARLVAWREGAALVGVLLASVLPSLVGLDATSAVLAVCLLAGTISLYFTLPAHHQPHQQAQPPRPVDNVIESSPWAHPPFVALMLVFLLNGSASAIPATLLPFFVRDTLQAGPWEPLFLVSYFGAAALGLPIWVRLVHQLGLARSWLLGMALSVLAFCAVPLLGAGNVQAFEVICALSGLALGADLAIPGALLIGVIHQAGWGQQGEGRVFGWWTAATKLNLALATGLALPLLSWLGYETGLSNARNQWVLGLAYGVLPCLLKVAAAIALYGAMRRHPVLKGTS